MIRALHVIAGAALLKAGVPLEPVLRAAASQPGRIALHLRAPELSAADLLEKTRALLGAPGLQVLVNDRVDVARVASAHGVQLGQGSLDATAARRLLGTAATIGASVHTAEEAAETRVADADFLLVGSIFETASHPERSGAGPELLRRISALEARPLVAIGGISPERVAVLLDAGAAGVAVQTGIWGAADPEHAVAAYLRALEDGTAGARGALARRPNEPTNV
ncbi:MAG: thiamine phosphate synthase [Gemmatimonadota bacterium]